ncbi:MAG: Alpha/beta hydrolase [Puniceicoccaceae bacterium 5H]|nr:MAG: Alpha/beta hydrolase [Puniceicoccaceae bacterium 5H]
MTLKLLTMAFATLATTLAAQTRPQDPMPLWPEGSVPGAQGTEEQDTPTLTPYWPAEGEANGAVMVICPGGGYVHLAEHEGRDYALWLNEHGITCFVLKYRLGSAGYRHPSMMQDVQRAIRTVRAHAGEWKLNPGKVGVMGSSAGGHLASTALTHFDYGQSDAEDSIERFSSRPDLGVLCYAVISMGPMTHQGSHDNLIGKDAAPELEELLSNELQVTDNTPPTFLWHTADDSVVPVQNSYAFAQALQEHGVPYDLHIYQTGHHGLGLGVRGYTPEAYDDADLLPWTHDLLYWLELNGFIQPEE